MSLTAYTTWTNERKDKPSEWSTFSQLSHFSKESHWRRVGFPLKERFRTSLELFGTSLDILNNMSKDVPTNFVLLWDLYEKSRHSQDKNDMSINLKTLAVDICIHWFHFYFPVSDTRWQKFSISQLCTMSPMLRNTMASRNTFSSRTEYVFSQVREHISLRICVSQGGGTHITTDMCFPCGEHIPLKICVSHVGEHISLGICVSQVGEHISPGKCVSQVGEHISLRICVSHVGEHISLGICVSLVGEHISLAICVSQVGEHISLQICVSHMGEHISQGLCVSHVGENISLGI